MNLRLFVLYLFCIGLLITPAFAYFEVVGSPSWITNVRNTSDINLVSSNVLGEVGVYDHYMSAAAFMTAYGLANHMHMAAKSCTDKEGANCSAGDYGTSGGVAGGWYWNGLNINTAIDRDWLVVKFYDENMVFKSNAWVISKNVWSPSSNVTLTFRDNLNSTLLSGVYVEAFYNGGNTTVEGYTDANGQINFGELPIEEITIAAWKTGYTYKEQVIIPSPVVYGSTIYLTSEPGFGVPETLNMTLFIRDANGGAGLSNVLVTLFDIIAGTSEIGLYTNASGVVQFMGVPNTAYIEGVLSKYGYVTRTWSKGSITTTGSYENTYYMQSVSSVTPTGTITPIVTPTSTPVPFDTWTLSANPDSIALGGFSTLLADCSNESKEEASGGLRTVLYYENNNLGASSQWKLIGVYNYNTSSTNFDFRPNNSVTYSYSASYEPMQLEVRPATAGTYSYMVALFGENSISLGTATDDIQVNGAGSLGNLVMNLYAANGATTAHLSNFYMNLTDDVTGQRTEYGLVTYDKDVSLPRGGTFTLRAYKTGYSDGSQSFTVPVDANIQRGDYGAIARVNLFPTGSTSAGNTSVVVAVNDLETYYPLPNVLISINGTGITSSPRYTGTNAESVMFLVPYNTTYEVTATKDGYCAVTDTGYSGTNSYQYVPLFMKYGACAGTTATPTPTPTITPTVTVTPIGGYGNQTGLATSCNDDLPANATIVQVLRNAAACNGITDDIGQGLTLAVVIILICAIILGRVAKGIGVLAGAIVGAVVSMAMGFLPFWIIIVLIILSGLIFAGKIFWSGGQ